jgi:hypothetical protein
MRSQQGVSSGRRGALSALAAIALVAVTLLGCGPGEVKAPNATRALDERRALEVIRQAVKNEGVDPAAGRDAKLTGEAKEIHIDVGIAGKDYGIAYISSDDAQKLGESIPHANKKDERLRLVRAGDDGETRIVLLYQDNYLYDDLAGEGHEQTTISCERALTRDVQDFITHARTQKYK